MKKKTRSDQSKRKRSNKKASIARVPGPPKCLYATIVSDVPSTQHFRNLVGRVTAGNFTVPVDLYETIFRDALVDMHKHPPIFVVILASVYDGVRVSDLLTGMAVSAKLAKVPYTVIFIDEIGSFEKKSFAAIGASDRYFNRPLLP